MSATSRVKIVVETGDGRWPVSISRVPCIGESVIVRKTLYDVREVVHHTNGDDIAAEITVSLPNIHA